MKRYFKLLLPLFLYVSCLNSEANTENYKNFVVLIASHNNENYTEQNIISAFQDYPEKHYRIIFIDDCSQDKTPDIVVKTIRKYNKQNIVTLFRNNERKGALFNHWHAINYFTHDDEIIVILDGDDCLAHKNVLSFLNTIYSDSDIWLTYGQFKHILTDNIGFNKRMPDDIVKNNAFRQYVDIPSHLRTFYSKLYKNIKKEDLMIDGEFFQMCADMATMIPMIEQARDHFKFIPEVLYRYNDINPLNDHKKNGSLQKALDKYIRTLPVYTPLEKLFLFHFK